MRRQFAKDLYELMREDKNIIFITADLGYGMADKIRDNLSDQFYNVMAAEQTMLSLAVGLALSGKIPVCYTITPFYFRAMEQIRLYVDHEKIPVIMVGGGRGEDYGNLGFSHHATDHGILGLFENIDFLVPEGTFDLKEIIYSGKPTYLNLKR
jgi:transketolase